MKLFIDDIRMPSDVGFVDNEWVIARNAFDAMQMIEQHRPQTIAFDHDLGDDGPDYGLREKTGLTVAQWLTHEDMRKGGAMITPEFTFTCHSANPVGKKNIEEHLNGYIKWKSEQ